MIWGWRALCGQTAANDSSFQPGGVWKEDLLQGLVCVASAFGESIR